MHTRILLARLFIPAAIAAASATSAWAVDGVVLIDQNRALAGGVTPGDTAGFPVTISLPGSYRLSGNLVVPNAGTTAIVVTAPNVTLDLNGFTIGGPTVCSGFPPSCTPAGTGMGIDGSTDARGLVVRNGSVSGMGSTGVSALASGSSIENLRVAGNGGWGILAELGTVTGNRVIGNGAQGIVGGNSVITQNVVVGNGGSGIEVNDSLVTHNAMIVNRGVGLAASNTGFAWNTFSSNNGGFANPQFSGRVPIGPNNCDGSVCP